MSPAGVDVCIIGAGFAGLAAARHLTHADRKVAVLEARDRVGGRVFSKALPDGRRFDVGGTWVGPDQTRVVALIEESGLVPYPTDETWRNAFHAHPCHPERGEGSHRPIRHGPRGWREVLR